MTERSRFGYDRAMRKEAARKIPEWENAAREAMGGGERHETTPRRWRHWLLTALWALAWLVFIVMVASGGVVFAVLWML